MSEIDIRTATVDDAGVIAALNIASWRETYEGLTPVDVMAALSLEERVEHWRAVLSDASSEQRPTVFLAFAADGSPAGFSSCRPQGKEVVLGRSGYGGEISALYLLKSTQRQGVGRRLMRLMAEDLRARDIAWISLWVLRNNFPARRFYERLGGRKIGVEGLWRSVPQVAYGWRDINRLVPHQ